MESRLLILASRSPRRAQLLRDAGYDFVQADPPFDDPPQPAGADAAIVTSALARRKAQSLRDAGILARHPGAVILAADTVCVGADGALIGQAHSRDEARTMIRSFLGQTHRVVSAVSILDEYGAHSTFADTATVVVGSISDAEVELYLDTQQWVGKAGAYNLFDRQDAGWPIRVEGDATTVVGLPMRRLTRELAKLSIHPANEQHSHPGVIQA